METEKKPEKFKRNATGVDKNRILEAEMGYECHPETDQSTIARERLEERWLNRKIHIQVRGTTCTECRRKTRKQIQSGFGTHNTDALETGAVGFCGKDRVLHRLRRQHTRLRASEYVLHVRQRRFRPLPTQLRSGGIIERSHPRCSRCPSTTAPSSKSIYCISIFFWT